MRVTAQLLLIELLFTLLLMPLVIYHLKVLPDILAFWPYRQNEIDVLRSIQVVFDFPWVIVAFMLHLLLTVAMTILIYKQYPYFISTIDEAKNHTSHCI